MPPADLRSAIRERAEALDGPIGDRPATVSPGALDRARQVAQGIVFFYGDTAVRVGLRGIDWVGGHICHQEWPAQLNRFGYLSSLTRAYRATGEERFAEAARAYIEDWVRAHPGYSPSYAPGHQTLDTAIRLRAWAEALPALLDSAAFDDAFLRWMLDSLAEQAESLSVRLSAWGNWRLTELDALVQVGLRLPFLPGAESLLRRGVRGMRVELPNQFLPDGAHIERTPHYHSFLAWSLVSYHELSRSFPEVQVGIPPEAIVRAFDYTAHSELSGFNDSIAPCTDPDRLQGLEARAAALRRLALERDHPRAPALEQVFPDAGHAFLRSAWEPGADYLAFDAGTWGGAHCHLSRLSFAFRSRGRALVCDPGILSYEMSDPRGVYGRSTPAHTTLTLNGCNQSEADAHLLRVERTPEAALIHAKYDGGYWDGEYHWGFPRGRGRGQFGAHERVLLWVKGEYLLCLDTMVADVGATVVSSWQMGPVDRWHTDPARLSWWSENADTNLHLRLVPFHESVAMECFEGNIEPVRGWVARGWHDTMPAPLVQFSYPASPGWSATAALLVPFGAGSEPRHTVREARRDGVTHQLVIELPGGDVDVVSWAKSLSGSAGGIGGPLVTDAPFVWLRLDPSGRARKALLVAGSYLEHAGPTLCEGEGPATRLLRFEEGVCAAPTPRRCQALESRAVALPPSTSGAGVGTGKHVSKRCFQKCTRSCQSRMRRRRSASSSVWSMRSVPSRSWPARP